MVDPAEFSPSFWKDEVFHANFLKPLLQLMPLLSLFVDGVGIQSRRIVVAVISNNFPKYGEMMSLCLADTFSL